MRRVSLAATLVTTVLAVTATAPFAGATTAEPCLAQSDFSGDVVVDTVDPANWQVFWNADPLYLTYVCGDRATVDDAFFSYTPQGFASRTDAFSWDAFDEFGLVKVDTYPFIADSWDDSTGAVVSEQSQVNTFDLITMDVTNTFVQEGNTLSWTVDVENGGSPYSFVSIDVFGDVGSDENTVVIDDSSGTIITHDNNAWADPIMVWRATDASFTQDFYQEDEVDTFGFSWTGESSVTVEVILIPNIQCVEDELTEDGELVLVDDSDSFADALAFATDSVAPNFDDYVGDTIDAFGDPSCLTTNEEAESLAATGISDTALLTVSAITVLVGGIAVQRIRRRSVR